MAKKHRGPFQAMALMSGILSYLVGPVVVGIFLGKWLDEQIGTKPIFLIVGLFLGLASGIYGISQLMRRYSGDDHD